MKKLLSLGVAVVVLTLLGKTEFSSTINFIFIIGGVLAMVLVTLVGRKLLDSNPTKVAEVIAGVQALRLLIYGIAITKAIKTADAWTFGMVIPFPQDLGLIILILTGLVLAFTMLNLALGGLGGPALVSSLRLATGWMYKYIRNPMILAMFSWLVSWGIYLQSMAFIGWVLFLVIPVEVFFEKHFEEKELEVRFGESYLQYKAITPFMFPHIALPQLLWGKMVLVSKRISLFVVVLGLFLVITAGTALAAVRWVEIPFSRGGAYINLDVREQKDVMVFWFLEVKVPNPSDYQTKLKSKKDSWTYQGRTYSICLRKIEVNFSKSPREVRSAFAVYYNANGEKIGNTEVSKSDWVAESGPRLWADLMRSVLSQEGKDTGEIPPLPVVLNSKGTGEILSLPVK